MEKRPVLLSVLLLDITQWQQHLEISVARQECLKQITLRPKDSESWIGKVNLIVFIRQFDVVKVDDHSLVECWQDFQNLEVYVAASFANVRRVDKEDVVLMERRKELHVHKLYRLFDHLGALWVSRQVHNRIGVDDGCIFRKRDRLAR